MKISLRNHQEMPLLQVGLRACSAQPAAAVEILWGPSTFRDAPTVKDGRVPWPWLEVVHQ